MRYRHVVGVLCTLALASVGIAASAAPGGAQVSAQQQEFTSNGTYWVPENVCQVEIEAFGGTGGPRWGPTTSGGNGGGIGGTFAVSPGEPLEVIVGQTGATSNGNGQTNALNSGGYGYYYGGDGRGAAGGGGGSSAVTQSGNPLIVAGGGGGARSISAGKTGGDGGAGEDNGSQGNGSGGGNGGNVGNPSEGGDATSLGATEGGSGGGGAGASGGYAGAFPSGGDFPGGAGGGGASNAWDTLNGAYAPGSGYPSGTTGETAETLSGIDGHVIIRRGDYGEGCVTATLQVRKKVGTNPVSNPAPDGYVVRIDCSDDPGDPTYLPFLSNGNPDSTDAPWGWYPVDGTWLHEFRSEYGVRCTATETDTGDATLVQYSCQWTRGLETPAAAEFVDEPGCPGATAQPSEDNTTSGTVLLEGYEDYGLLTVYNDFPEEPVTPDTPDTPIEPVNPPAAGPTTAAAPAAIVAAARFTG